MPVLNSSLSKATPQSTPFFENDNLPSTMSRSMPITSPGAMASPYFWPSALELCLVSPLYMAQPSASSQKAEFKFFNHHDTPIFMRFPFRISIEKKYFSPGVKAKSPSEVLKPAPYLTRIAVLSLEIFSQALVCSESQ